MEAEVKTNKYAGCKIFKFSLSTGGSCYIIPKYGCKKGFAAAVINVGSSDISAQKEGEKIMFPSGTAHFTEHKMFEKETGDAMAEFSKLGANANAFTDLSKTVYYFSCSDNFYEALNVLIQMVFKPYFSENTIERERQIIEREIAMYKDENGWKAYFSMLSSLYGESRRFEEISGSIESIYKISANTLRKFYDCFYTGENISFVICADIDPMKCAEIIEENSVKRKHEKIVYSCEEFDLHERFADKSEKSKMPVFDIGFAIDKKADIKNICCAEIITEALYGRGSLYRRKMLKKNICAFPLNVSQCFGRGFYFVSAEGRSLKSRQAVQYAFYEMKKAAVNGIDSKTLDYAKNMCTQRLISIFKDAQSIVMQQSILNNINSDLFEKYDCIQNIETDYIMYMLEKGFGKANISVAVHGI